MERILAAVTVRPPRCETPNNVIDIDNFADLFDGFSIGSNDLTQLTLGDRPRL